MQMTSTDKIGWKLIKAANRNPLFHRLQRKLHRHRVLEDKMAFQTRLAGNTNMSPDLGQMLLQHTHPVEMLKQVVSLTVISEFTSEIRKLFRNFSLRLAVVNVFAFDDENAT